MNKYTVNIVGMRRTGFSRTTWRELNFHYKRIFVEGNNVGATVAESLASQPGNKAREMLEFIAASTRRVREPQALAHGTERFAHELACSLNPGRRVWVMAALSRIHHPAGRAPQH